MSLEDLADLEDDYHVEDWQGARIKVGTVCVYGSPPVEDDDYDVEEFLVKVTSITDPDADYDDELGRGVRINPKVRVEFLRDGVVDTMSTIATSEVNWSHYPDGPVHEVFVCDDLEVRVVH